MEAVDTNFLTAIIPYIPTTALVILAFVLVIWPIAKLIANAGNKQASAAMDLNQKVVEQMLQRDVQTDTKVTEMIRLLTTKDMEIFQVRTKLDEMSVRLSATEEKAKIYEEHAGDCDEKLKSLQEAFNVMQAERS